MCFVSAHRTTCWHALLQGWANQPPCSNTPAVKAHRGNPRGKMHTRACPNPAPDIPAMAAHTTRAGTP